jgi:hypothetical protein
MPAAVAFDGFFTLTGIAAAAPARCANDRLTAHL